MDYPFPWKPNEIEVISNDEDRIPTKVTIEGIDMITGKKITETVTLNGTKPITTKTIFIPKEK